MNHASSNEVRPIFVVGAPRTGTTLAMRILNLHPQVHLYNEVHYNERVVDPLGNGGVLPEEQLARAARILLDHSPWASGTGDLEEDCRILVDRVRQGEISHRRLFAEFLGGEATANQAVIWGDSSPQDCLYMTTLKAWYPGARFIGIIRDPRAYLASYKNYYRKEIASYRDRFNPVTNAILWRTYMNAVLDFHHRESSTDTLLLKYESLVSDPEGEIRRLCRFLDLDFHEQMLQVPSQNSSYFTVGQDDAHQGISAGSRDRWREELADHEVWILERLCGPTMQILGYELSGTKLTPRMTPGLLKTAAMMPGRLFNLMFRTNKPFTFAKLGRVLRGMR